MHIYHMVPIQSQFPVISVNACIALKLIASNLSQSMIIIALADSPLSLRQLQYIPARWSFATKRGLLEETRVSEVAELRGSLLD